MAKSSKNLRWLVRVGAFDYGPFDVEEVTERIRDGRLTLRSEVCEEIEGRWVRLEEVPVLRDICLALIEEEKERRRQEEMDRTEQQVRRTHKIAWSFSHFGLIGVLVAAGVVVFLITSKPDRKPSGYDTGIFYLADLDKIEPWRRFAGQAEHEWRFGPDVPERLAAKKPRRRRSAGFASNKVYEDDSQAGFAMSFDFGDEEGGGRKLSEGEIEASVVPKARARLSRCLLREAERRAEVSSATFRFAVLPTGRLAGGKVLGKMSGKMHACVKSALRGIKIPPFSGAPRWVELPLSISGR